MANDKIQKLGYGSTRAIIKASEVEDREPIWNPTLKELLVKYSSGVGWFEIPSEERLYTGITDTVGFPRNTDGDQESGAHFIGVKGGFTNILGNRPLHNTLQSIDTQFGNRLNKDASVNSEADQTFEKGIIVNDDTGIRQLGKEKFNVQGSAGAISVHGNELFFNREFELGEIGWGGINDKLSLETSSGNTVIRYDNFVDEHEQYLYQEVGLAPGTYVFTCEITEINISGYEYWFYVGGSDGQISYSNGFGAEGTGTQTVEFTIDELADEFVMVFSQGDETVENSYVTLANFSLKKTSPEILTDGSFDVNPPTINWEINLDSDVAFNPETGGGTCKFLPTGISSSYGDSIRQIFETFLPNTWHEFTYDVISNTDINSIIHVYIQTGEYLNQLVEIDTAVGTNKKVVFKSSSTTDFSVVFVCTSATPDGAYIEIKNLSLRQMTNGNLDVGEDIKIGGDIDVGGSISQANISGYLNLNPARIGFTSNKTISMDINDIANPAVTYYPAARNATIIDVTDRYNFSTVPTYYEIQLPAISDVGDGRIYIFINRTNHNTTSGTGYGFKLLGSGTDTLRGGYSQTCYIALAEGGVGEVVMIIANGDNIANENNKSADDWTVVRNFGLLDIYTGE